MNDRAAVETKRACVRIRLNPDSERGMGDEPSVPTRGRSGDRNASHDALGAPAGSRLRGESRVAGAASGEDTVLRQGA
jgi:hypothetical protein